MLFIDVILFFGILKRKLLLLVILRMLYNILIALFLVVLLVTFILFFANNKKEFIVIVGLSVNTIPLIFYQIFLTLLKLYVQQSLASEQSIKSASSTSSIKKPKLPINIPSTVEPVYSIPTPKIVRPVSMFVHSSFGERESRV